MTPVSIQRPGTAFARALAAIAQAKGNRINAAAIARARFPGMPSIAVELEKTAIGAATPSGAAWADDLFMPGGIAQDFVGAVRARTVVDRLVALGARLVPFTLPIPKESSAGFGASWAGAGAARPVKKTALDTVTLPRYHAGVITVLSNELLRVATPAHEAALLNILIASVTQYLDQQFLDPSVSAVANVSPASITNGATQVTSTGATAAAMLQDFRSMVAAVTTNLVSPIWIMQRRDAVLIATTLTSGGALAFPNITAQGGTLLGVPVLTTSAVPDAAGSPATDRYIILMDADSVLIADEGRAGVQRSTKSALQMDDAPTNNSASGTATSMVSLWQTESAAFRIDREISWTRGISGGVSYMRVSY